ncbi:MAG: hypothetical protein KIT81_09670 [Alphaproteobacteria bacterium]|nr:hypothetical protein [Alphaproteobacteria bacterium]
MRALLAALALLAGLAAAPLAAQVPEDGTIAFTVTRNGREIGEHVLSFRRVGDLTEVEIAIDLRVNIAFIPVFRYIHRNREIWQGGRLASIETRTDDDGTPHTVSARLRGEFLEIRSSAGNLRLPADTMPTSYWDRRVLKQSQLLNTQTGELVQVQVSEVGPETVRVGGREVPSVRYRIDGDLKTDIWYAVHDNTWTGLRFATKDGSVIQYERRQ